MKKLFNISALLMLTSFLVHAQVGVNTNAVHESAMLEVYSTDKGFLPPRLNQAQVDALNAKGAVEGPAKGLVLYNTDIPCLQFNRGTKLAPDWVCLDGTSQVVTPPGAITSLDCNSANPSSPLVEGGDAAGITFSVPYSGGNDGPYSLSAINSSSVTNLVATPNNPTGTLSASGNLEFTLSGTPSGTGTAEFALSVGGQSCTVSIPVQAAGPPPGTITSLDCNSANPSSPLVAGVDAAGITFSVPYSGGNDGTYSLSPINSSSVTNLVATPNNPTGILSASGNLEFTLSGTPSGTGTAEFLLSVGGQSCNVTVPVAAAPGAITGLNCASASVSGSLTENIAASGVSFTVSYTGGNGGSHMGQTVSSTGVTGLTATLGADSFNSGTGDLVYTISGTPTSAGTASFALNIGGQSCNVTIPVVPGVGVVTSPVTGRVWMDRNLGAASVASNPLDPQGFGHYYQYGRNSDGHEIVTWGTDITNPISQSNHVVSGPIAYPTATPNPNLIVPAGLGGMWDATYDTSAWGFDTSNPNSTNITKGPEDPCPAGFRVPTIAEFVAETAGFNDISDSFPATGQGLRFTNHPGRMALDFDTFRGTFFRRPTGQAGTRFSEQYHTVDLNNPSGGYNNTVVADLRNLPNTIVQSLPPRAARPIRCIQE